MHPPKKKKTGIGLAHSKVILIGEHSVVYGKPAIAFPFHNLNVKVTIEEHNQGVYIECGRFSGKITDIPKGMVGLKTCIEETFHTLNKKPERIKIKIHSKIPIGKGLGSSAAIAVAIVRAIYDYFHLEPSHDDLMELVHRAETYAHGTPSGIDMQSVAHDMPIWFIKGHKPEPVEIGEDVHMIVADTGRVGKTRLAVLSIREKLMVNGEEAETSIKLLGDYTFKARELLKAGDIKQLGHYLNLAQEQLDLLGVSDEGINHLVMTARKCGAFGAKLTGGGRGGCMIAITDTKEKAEQIARELKMQGAKAVWPTVIKKNVERK
mgnify:CR=1 FL=1